MHKALWLQEILREIFFLVDGDSDDKRTLAQCCLICRHFYEPAADALWYHIPSLAPLIKCLPKEFYEEVSPDDDDGDGIRSHSLQSEAILHFRGTEVAAEHWERVDRHARRVRIMESHRLELLETVDISVLDVIALRYEANRLPRPPAECFLPNLQVLFWPFFREEAPSFAKIPLIAGSRLRAFRSYALYGRHDRKYLTRILEVMEEFPRSFPRLEKIEMPSFSTIPLDGVDEVCSTMLQNLRYLRNIVLPSVSLTKAAWTYLATLPNIEKLDVAGEHLRHDYVPLNPPTPSFPSLRVIKLIGISQLPACVTLIESLSHVQLDTVDIAGDVSGFDLKSLTSLFRALSVHKTLKKISLDASFRQVPEIDPESPSFNISILEPLLVLSRLNSCNISIPVEIDLKDEDYLRMARSWPHIEWLVIKLIGRSRKTPSATFDAFLHVARHCPELRSFQLGLEPTLTEAAEAEAARHTSESVVEWLSMKFQSAIPPHETDRLCKYVLDLFPKLRVVRSIPASINIDLNAFHRTESWTNLCAMIRKRCKESNP